MNYFQKNSAIVGAPPIGVARGGPAPSQIEMLPMRKCNKKRLYFLQFLLASSRTTVHANNSNKQ